MPPLNISNPLPTNLKWYALSKIAIPVLPLAFVLMSNQAALAGLFSFVVVFLLPIWLYVVLSYKFTSYVITESLITINSGILFKRSHTIPFTQVQNTNSSRGPLSSAFGLSHLEIWTASPSQIVISKGKSSNKPDFEIWLDKAQAQEVKEFILSRK